MACFDEFPEFEEDLRERAQEVFVTDQAREQELKIASASRVDNQSNGSSSMIVRRTNRLNTAMSSSSGLSNSSQRRPTRPRRDEVTAGASGSDDELAPSRSTSIASGILPKKAPGRSSSRAPSSASMMNIRPPASSAAAYAQRHKHRHGSFAQGGGQSSTVDQRVSALETSLANLDARWTKQAVDSAVLSRLESVAMELMSRADRLKGFHHARDLLQDIVNRQVAAK